MAETPKTIVLSGSPQYKEGTCGEAMTPGHLIEVIPSGGDAGKFRKHTNAGQNAQRSFAIESQLPNSDTTAPIDTPYADEERLHYVVCRSGDVVYAWLADGENADIGAFLQSADGGELGVHTPPASGTIYSEAVVGRAVEALDNSAGGAAARLRVEVV